MAPFPTMHNRPNTLASNSIFARYSGEGQWTISIRGKDIYHIGLRELSRRMICALRGLLWLREVPIVFANRESNMMTIALAAFIDHIRVIISLGPKEEMVGANTVTDIAAMASIEPWRNWPIAQLVSDPVSPFLVTTDTEGAIARAGKRGTCPEPAIARAINLLPESICDRSRASVLIRHNAKYTGMRG